MPGYTYVAVDEKGKEKRGRMDAENRDAVSQQLKKDGLFPVAAAAFIMTVGKFMTYLFVSEDVNVIMSSVDVYLKCIGIFFIPLAIVNIYRNGIQGLGYGLLPMMAGVAELIGRGVVAVIAGEMRSYTGVCLAGPAAWSLAAALLIVMYFFIMNVHLKKVFGTNGKD